MQEVPDTLSENIESPAPELRLIVAQDSWFRVSVQNLRDFFYQPEGAPLHLESAPAAFWPDVFVERKLPWRRFFESGGYHVMVLVMIWAGSRYLALQPQVTSIPTFTHAEVVYYTPSEYLPPLDTRQPAPAPAQTPDPELSAQPIISVPAGADNHSQTVVTAPQIRLQHDVPLPNTVAWSDKPQMPIAPAPVLTASQVSRFAPEMEHSVIAPPPDIQEDPRNKLEAPQSAVIAPPPALDAASNRRLGELNIGSSPVIAPAPQLSLDEQRTMPRSSFAVDGHTPRVIAPPPSMGASGGSRAGGDMIALSLHPAVGAPPEPGAGNRRGAFAATPEGHRGASGSPGSSAGDASTADGSGAGNKTAGKLPSGLYVGKTSNPASAVAGDPGPANSSRNLVNPNLIANTRPPRISRTPPESDVKISEAERAVFGGRKSIRSASTCRI